MPFSGFDFARFMEPEVRPDSRKVCRKSVKHAVAAIESAMSMETPPDAFDALNAARLARIAACRSCGGCKVSRRPIMPTSALRRRRPPAAPE